MEFPQRAGDKKEAGHTTVLLQEAIQSLALKSGDVAIDATAGLGGHTEAIARSVGPSGLVLALDADQESLAVARKRLNRFGRRITFSVGNFRDIDAYAARAGIHTAGGVLFDLGWNATQLVSGRGFSFMSADPLLMTYEAGPHEGTLTAGIVVNTWSEYDLAEIIRVLGEERFAARIASRIVSERKHGAIETAERLREIIERALPRGRRGKIHPATKTFQALRMVVNNELAALTEALPKAFAFLKRGGRLSVISFHSLEDSLVKRAFKALANEGRGTLVTKKPVTPTLKEVKENPRARSAKLRTIEKL